MPGELCRSTAVAKPFVGFAADKNQQKHKLCYVKLRL